MNWSNSSSRLLFTLLFFNLAFLFLDFRGSNKTQQIAVLHPRLLSVYSLQKNQGSSEDGDVYALNLAYQHKLARSSFSIVVGPFGGLKNKDFICVQSLDGALNVFEQESFAFSRFLPGYLLPGPLIYIKRTDSFVTASSAWMLESYK